jgi:hypothetical protein
MGGSLVTGAVVPTNMIGVFNGLTTTARYSTANDSATYTVPANKKWIIVTVTANYINSNSGYVRHETGIGGNIQYLIGSTSTDIYRSTNLNGGYVAVATEVIRIASTGSFTYYEVNA